MPFLWHSQGWWSCASGEERGMEDRGAASPRQNIRGVWPGACFCLACLQGWEGIIRPARLAAARLPEFPLQIPGLIRSQRQRVAVCAGGAQGSFSLLGPCLDLVTWLGWKGLWAGWSGSPLLNSAMNDRGRELDQSNRYR